MSEEQQVVTVQETKKKEIEISNGDVRPKTLEELYRYSNSLVSSGMLPKMYDKAEKVMAAIQLANELGLPPLNALKNISIVNGSPSLWGDLPLAIVRASGDLEAFREFCIDKDYKEICFENKNLGAEIYAAICVIKRKGYEKRSFHYTMMDAAMNPNSGNPTWKAYRSIMMKRKARSIALKDEFSDKLVGCSIAEYDHDVIPNSAVQIDTKAEKVAALNEKFS